MCGVAVHVHATVEHGSSILAETAANHGFTTGVVVDKVRYIVHNTCHSDEGATILGLVHVVVPLENRELLQRYAPVELRTLLVELLLLLLDAAFFDFIGAELLEVVGEAELLHGPDEPLGGVILVPLNGIAVVGWKLVVEVVVALAEGDQGGDDVVTRRVAVVEWLVAEPVSKRVDTKGSLLNEEDAQNTGIDESTDEVTPAETSNQRREDETCKDDDLEVVLVLPDDNGVVVEIGDVGTSNALRVLLHQHPAEMRVEKTLADAVGVLVGVGVAVVGTVVARPPSDRALHSATSHKCQKDLEWE